MLLKLYKNAFLICGAVHNKYSAYSLANILKYELLTDVDVQVEGGGSSFKPS